MSKRREMRGQGEISSWGAPTTFGPRVGWTLCAPGCELCTLQ